MTLSRTVTGHLAKLLAAMLLPALFSLYSCKNDISTVSVLLADTLPAESAKDIQLVYSDSAEVAVIVKSPVMHRFEGNEPYLDFPKGVEVVFYNKGLKEKSKLTCRHAKVFENTKIMEAYSKVEIRSLEKEEKLNTEHLVWDERQGKIYTNEFVKITTKDKVLYGHGFESDQNFDHWIIRKPTGSFALENEAEGRDK